MAMDVALPLRVEPHQCLLVHIVEAGPLRQPVASQVLRDLQEVLDARVRERVPAPEHHERGGVDDVVGLGGAEEPAGDAARVGMRGGVQAGHVIERDPVAPREALGRGLMKGGVMPATVESAARAPRGPGTWRRDSTWLRPGAVRWGATGRRCTGPAGRPAVAVGGGDRVPSD